jgi:hypothetical protein
MVGWLGDRAESRARRWRQWGGRWDAGSSEQAAQPGLHSGVQAQEAPEGKLEAIWRSRQLAEHGAQRQQQWRPWRGLGARARRDDTDLYIRARGDGVDFLHAKRVVVVGSRYGRGTAGWAATCSGRRASGVRQRHRPTREGGARGTGLRL